MMQQTPCSTPKIVVTLLALVVAAGAQVYTHEARTTADDPYEFYSPRHTNPGAAPIEVLSHVVNVPGAPMLRLFFQEVDLGEHDVLRVRNPLDGEIHDLTAEELRKWRHSSAAFNGDTLILSAIIQPGSSVQFSLEKIRRALPDAVAPESICGTGDDRVLSSDNRVARFSGSCTIWLVGNNACAVSAGHCFGSLSTAEFNVPLSTGGGAIQAPPVADQFPIDQGVSVWNNGGQGNDYGVTRLLTNNLGQTVHQRYGVVGFGLAPTLPSVGQSIRVTGYGTTSAPVTATWNQVQKTHSGPYALTTGTTLGYTTDTTGGNSGSPVIHEPSGAAIGVHTHAGCSATSGTYNRGTSYTLGGFSTAFANVCGGAAPSASFTVSPSTACVGQTVQFTDTSTGAPTSWAWDLNGDGLVDSNAQNPTFSYATAGNIQVTLTVGNGSGTNSVTVPGAVTVAALVPATVPYTQSFQGGLPVAGGPWCFRSDNPAGAIAAAGSGTASPISGDPALTMATNVNGTFATNEAVLVMNLANTTNVQLSYWWKETADEDHPQDGVFFSDGVTEVLAFSHQAGPAVWTQQVLNVSTIAANAGLTVGNGFQIIFRQYDNFILGTDGVLIDDIAVLGTSTTFDLTLFTTGAGDAYVQIQNVPSGTVQGYTLFSFLVNQPVGTGSFNGIFPDSVTLFIVFSPATPGDLFHWTWPVAGIYPSVPFTLPPGSVTPGTTLDGVGLAYNSAAQLIAATPARRIVF